MGTLSRLVRGVSSRYRITGSRLAIAVLIVGVLLGLVSCASSPADQAGAVENPTVISYAGAASWLRGLEPADVQEQLRDWARTGLASHLALDTAQLRDGAYDTVPVRDAAFADLSKQSTGPGRALFDGRGLLHVLVPLGDPHEARTIGLLIDQYRSDAGTDPQQVQIHHYQIHSDAQTIELIHEKPAPTADIRSAHGFVTMRVDDRKGLADFLARTRQLSWLEARGSEIWAGGWSWPDVPGVPLDVEDISAIQRGYLQPSTGPLPGFSLDPGPVNTRDDVLAVIPDLRPELADRLISHDWSGSAFPSTDGLQAVVKGALDNDDPQPATLPARGLPSDRTQLWALDNLLTGHPAYSQARTDGRLQGTDVEMTLFYTDKVAKDWVHGVGAGVPTAAVGGFVANPAAVTPWGHCPEGPVSEYGRLWFGQNDSGFTVDGNRVSIGAQSTRLFSRSDAGGGTEVEPSFRVGRGMRWWDQHFQEVADYEPQYQRLDQIMRWSGALDLLVPKTQARLPQLDDSAIRSDLRFQDWYAQHDELRERSPIDFVTPPSATREAIRSQPSETYNDCGFRAIGGGVSLGDLSQREGGRSFHADLPESLRRGGLFDEASHIDPATGTGQVTQVAIDNGGNVIDRLRRTFSTTPDGRAVVDVVADGRQVVPFGKLKAWLAGTAPRKLKVEFASSPGQISERVELQDQELGKLVAYRDGDTVHLQWRRGVVDRVRRMVESVQDRLVAHPATEAPPALDGVLYGEDVNGRLQYKTGGPGAPWLSITSDLRPPGDDLAFRLGGPDPGTGQPRFFQATLGPRPEARPVGDGSPQWIEVTPATNDHPATMRPALAPDEGARTVPVVTPNGARATVSQLGDHVWAPADDPILGVDGTAEGAALLRNFHPVDDAMRAAAQAGDGLLRAVRLGTDGEDGVALVGVDGVTLAAADHPWADRVLRAITFDPSQQVPLFQLDGGRALHADPSPLTVLPGSTRHTTFGEVPYSVGDSVYVYRSLLVTPNGMIYADTVPRETKVTVREAVVEGRPSAAATATPPDIRLHEGGQWYRVTGFAPVSNSTTSTTPTPAPANPSAGLAPALSGRILLVCPDTNEKLPGCED